MRLATQLATKIAAEYSLSLRLFFAAKKSGGGLRPPPKAKGETNGASRVQPRKNRGGGECQRRRPKRRCQMGNIQERLSPFKEA